jgi:hypothetical protein
MKVTREILLNPPTPETSNRPSDCEDAVKQFRDLLREFFAEDAARRKRALENRNIQIWEVLWDAGLSDSAVSAAARFLCETCPEEMARAFPEINICESLKSKGTGFFFWFQPECRPSRQLEPEWPTDKK